MSTKFRPEIADLVPYQPGKPAEELMRERGLTSVIKLASNEGPWGPLPAAAQVIADGISGLNRYPDGGCVLLREALAQRHNVRFEEIVVGHGADSIINNLSVAALEPDDEVVFGWPSFPSYLLDAKKMGATPVPVPLDGDYRYDLDALLAAITDRTKIVYVCNPNNPTGTMVGRDALARFVAAVPAQVLCVLDEAYHEYVDHPEYADGAAEFFSSTGNVVVLRTFSKIFGLAGLRVGYAVAPSYVVDAVEKVRNAFDVTSLAQDAAVASLDELDLLAARTGANREGLALLMDALSDLDVDPVPSVANFICVDLRGADAAQVYDRLLDQGIIVRPLAPFGLAGAVRVTVGTPEETQSAATAMQAVLSTISVV